MLDDTVILARATAEATSNQYDPIQNQVLSGENGLSGKGEPEGTTSKKYSDDNLEKAQDYMSKVFNGNVQVLTVTNPKAVDLMEQIKTNLKSSSVPYERCLMILLLLLK